MRYYDDDDEIEAAAVFNHPGEVVGLSTTAAFPDLIASLGSENGKVTGAVWRMPTVPASDGEAGYRASAPTMDMERLCTLPSGTSNLQHIAWCPAPLGDGPPVTSDAAGDQLIAVDDSSAQVWRIRPGAAAAPTSVASLQVGGLFVHHATN